MAGTVDELTVRYEEDGKVLVEEIDKRILSKGSWTTILFLFRSRNRQSGEFDAPQAAIRRYQKVRGTYMLRSKFTISSARQAHQIAEAIQQWFPQDDPTSSTE
ncbi:MAG: hypothetical protein JXP34_27665 [Planctomycetes bacterium]|nr:hypothetical protein [Planctomycetota bacterium]